MSGRDAAAGIPQNAEQEETPPAASPAAGFPRIAATAAAACCGLLLGLYELQNTSIGWHLAAGRWMIGHGEILRQNPFTFTAAGHPWLDHEWLFQLLAAGTDSLAGVHALVALRMLVVALLSLLLFRQSRRGGLPTGSALLAVVLCLLAARWRFYLRPELLTLILLPLGLEIFLRRGEGNVVKHALALALIMVIGINAHAGILLLPLLALIAAAGDRLQELLNGKIDIAALGRDGFLMGVMGVAALCNPWGVRAVAAPFKLASLVSMPWVRNPEWFTPTWKHFPELYLIIPAGLLLLLFFEGSWARRLLFVAISILAMRYVRNEGIFFVLLPLLLTPAIVRGGSRLKLRLDEAARKRMGLFQALVALLLCVVSLNANGFPIGIGWSKSACPIRAACFLSENHLLEDPVYNDVRFGGWLIGHFYPPVRFFVDDRNEVHEELLKKIWEIQSSSSPRRWQKFLDSWKIRTAILKYHPPVPVQDPEGKPLGFRGWSALWFPSSRWALVYWDDVAMILVNRKDADPGWLARREYRALRPDDGSYLRRRISSDREFGKEVAGELGRRLEEDPDCRKALDLAAALFR